jgi:hypothetical protein
MPCGSFPGLSFSPWLCLFSLDVTCMVQTLDVSYCPEWGANQELSCLVPLSRTLLRLGLKGTEVTDEDMTRYFHEVHAQLDFQTTMSPLLELDLSAISKEGSIRISNVTVQNVVVRIVQSQ